MKLSATMMEGLHQESNTSAVVESKAALSGLFRSLIFDYVSNYVGKGDAAMIKCVDKAAPVQASTQFSASWKNSIG